MFSQIQIKIQIQKALKQITSAEGEKDFAKFG